MARPLKNNADFYGHDSDMRKNIKVRAAKAKFGIYGGYVFPTLLEILTESDNLKIKINGLCWLKTDQTFMTHYFTV